MSAKPFPACVVVLVTLASSASWAAGTCVAPPANLVSWWTGDGTDADETGLNPGHLLHGVGFAPGMVGPGFIFDGVNDVVWIPDSSSLSPRRITVDAWVYPTGNQGLNRHIISKDNEVETREWILSLNSDNRFHAFVQLPSGARNLAGATTVQLNTWYHVAMTHDGSRLRLYVNGVLDGVLNAVGNLVPTVNPVGIGGNPLPVFFQGIVDETQVFRRALDAAEISAIYQAGPNGQCKPKMFASAIAPTYTVRNVTPPTEVVD